MNYLVPFLIFCVAQTLAWLQVFSAHVPGLSKVHWLAVVATVGTAAGVCFRWATASVLELGTGAWTARILAFAAGNIMFAILTYAFMNEGIDKRTAIALLLCLAAVLVKVL